MQWGKLPGSIDFDDGWIAYVYLNDEWGSFQAVDPTGQVRTYHFPFGMYGPPYVLDVDHEVVDGPRLSTGFWARIASVDPLGTVRVGRLIGD